MFRILGYMLVSLVLAAPASAASLDAGFGSDGRVVLDFGSQTAATAGGLAVQPDGKIVIAGWIQGSFGLVRLLPDGGLDPSFGSGGVALLGFGAQSTAHNAPALALEPDGKAVVAGSVYGPGGVDFALARTTAGGVLDPTFGSGGKVTTPVAAGNGDDMANDVVVQPDGRIVAAGSAAGYFAAVRYLSDGRPDASFGSGGIVTRAVTPDAPGDSAAALALGPDGSLTLAGTTIQPVTGFDVAALRLTAQGAVDAGFGRDGWSTLALEGNAWQGVADVALVPGGGALLAGWSFPTSGSSMRIMVVGLQPDGSPDPAFADGGSWLSPVGPTQDMAHALLPAGTTTYVAIDSRAPENDARGNTVYARRVGILALDSGGRPDSAFAGGGTLLFHLTPLGDDRAVAVAQRPDGALVLLANVHPPDAVQDTIGVAVVLPRSQAPIVPPTTAAPPATQRVAPVSVVVAPRKDARLRRVTTLRGRASGELGVQRVDVALVRIVKRNCMYLRGPRVSFRTLRSVRGRCSKLIWLEAKGTTRWSYALRKRLPPGLYVLHSRASGKGLVESTRSGSAFRVLTH